MTVQLLSHLQVQTSEQKPSLPRGTAGRGEWRSKSCTPWHVVLKMARAHQTPKISFLPALRFNNVIKHLLALQQHWVRRPSLPLDSNETLQNTKAMRRTHEQLLTEIITTLSYNTAPPATCLLPALSTSPPFTTPSWFALAMGQGTTCSACARLTTATCSLLRVLPHPREGQTHARWSREQDEPFNSSQPRHLVKRRKKLQGDEREKAQDQRIQARKQSSAWHLATEAGQAVVATALDKHTKAEEDLRAASLRDEIKARGRTSDPGSSVSTNEDSLVPSTDRRGRCFISTRPGKAAGT